jgi:hypothetical protein
MKKVEVAKLILDFTLYPRCQVDSQHVSYMCESLKAGVELPPVVIDEASFRVIDGFHRVTAVKRFSGDTGKVTVIFKKYSSEQEMFSDAMRYNASHGRSLTQYDRSHCIIRAEELNIDEETLAKCLNVTVDKIGELRRTRIGELKTSTKAKKNARFKRQIIPLKRTIEHMAGLELTQSQVNANEKLGGMNQQFYINQLISLIENDLLNMSDERLMKRLEVLSGLLIGLFSISTKKNVG